MYTKFLIFLASALFSNVIAVTIKSCSKDNIVQVNWLNVQPAKIVVPGDISLSVSATLTQPLTGNLDADLTISRRFGPMWIDLPCVSTAHGQLGSCTYRNLCGDLMRNGSTCPRLLSANNIPCTCPVAPQTYNLPHTVFPIDLSTINLPSIAYAGEYQASLRVIERTTMKEIICLDFDVEITEPQKSSAFGGLGTFLVNLFG